MPPTGTPPRGARPTARRADVAFNDEMTAWCSSCHTRYYAVSLNPNPTGTKPGPPASKVVIMSSDAAANRIYTAADNANVAVNDQVSITGHGDAAVNGNWYVAAAGNDGTTAARNRWFTVKATLAGAVFDIPTGSRPGAPPTAS